MHDGSIEPSVCACGSRLTTQGIGIWLRLNMYFDLKVDVPGTIALWSSLCLLLGSCLLW